MKEIRVCSVARTKEKRKKERKESRVALTENLVLFDSSLPF